MGWAARTKTKHAVVKALPLRWGRRWRQDQVPGTLIATYDGRLYRVHETGAWRRVR